MADNIAITAGSGTTIAADDVSSVYYQRVKLVDGTDGQSTAVAVDVGAKANALRVAPANDITDATYIGDIKFGESLPAGTAAIGKLASNSGVDIGDVDVLSLPDVTSATHGNFLADVTLQLADTDVSATNPVPVRPNEYELSGNTTHVKKKITCTGTDDIVWSPAAGKRWYVTDIVVSSDAAATLTLEDDLVGGDSAVLKVYLAANGGFVSNFNTPLYSGEDAADLIATTTAGNVEITVTGYEI